MPSDLDRLREQAVKGRETYSFFKDAVEMIDLIKSNKGFLAISAAKKNEFNGNRNAIVKMHAEIAEAREILDGLSVKTREAREYLASGYQADEKKMNVELEVYRAEQKTLVHKGLDAVRDQVKEASKELKGIYKNIDSANAKLQTIQYSIRDILTVE